METLQIEILDQRRNNITIFVQQDTKLVDDWLKFKTFGELLVIAMEAKATLKDHEKEKDGCRSKEESLLKLKSKRINGNISCWIGKAQFPYEKEWKRRWKVTGKENISQRTTL